MDRRQVRIADTVWEWMEVQRFRDDADTLTDTDMIVPDDRLTLQALGGAMIDASGYGDGENFAIVRVAAVPQGEPSDAHLSSVSVNGVRQTWQQLHEREQQARIALQGCRRMLSDRGRNATGRYQGDADSVTCSTVRRGKHRYIPRETDITELAVKQEEAENDG